MPKGRRSARRMAVFVLYQMDLLELTPQAALEKLDDSDTPSYTRELVEGVAKNLTVLDRTISDRLEGWPLSRLGFLERAILRLSTYELLYCPDVPTAVVIDEAVELAKRFCAEEAGALTNGVLGRLLSEGVACPRTEGSQPPSPDGTEI